MTTFLPTTRTMLGMATYGALPKRFASIHPRYLTPGYGTVVAGIIAGTFYAVLTFVSEAVLTDTILSLGLMICFYYGLTAIGCVWYFRKELFTSFNNIIFKFLFPLLGGIGLWIVFFITIRDSASPDYDGSGVSIFGVGVVLVLGLGLDPARRGVHVDHAGQAAGVLPRRDPEPGHPVADHPGVTTPGRCRTPSACPTLTTLRLGGPAPDLVTVRTAEEIADVVGAADRAGAGVLVLGGGSNLVVADRGIDTPVVRIGVRGIRIDPDGDGKRADGGTAVTIGAGENWDDVVAELTGQGFAEFATLSGIPGSAGATPIQNVGAYGTEIAEVLTGGHRLRPGHRGRPATCRPPNCGLGYRHSVLRGTDRAVVSDDHRAAAPRRGRRSGTPNWPARSASRSAPRRRRPRSGQAVLDLRRKKGMVLDPDDPDTYSVGSFFTNPILGTGPGPRCRRGDQGQVRSGRQLSRATR